MPAEHRADRLNVPLREPKPLRVLIDHKHIPVAIRAAQQNHGVVSEAIIQRREPLPRTALIKFINRVDLAPESRKKLPCRNVPIPIKPRPLLPSSEILQHPRVLRVVERIVPDPRRNESAFGFLSLLKRNDEPQP